METIYRLLQLATMFHEPPSPRGASSRSTMASDDDEDYNWLKELIEYNRESRLKGARVKDYSEQGPAECLYSG